MLQKLVALVVAAIVFRAFVSARSTSGFTAAL